MKCDSLYICVETGRHSGSSNVGKVIPVLNDGPLVSYNQRGHASLPLPATSLGGSSSHLQSRANPPTKKPSWPCACACCARCQVAERIHLQVGKVWAPNCARRHAHIIATTEIFVYHPHRLAVDLDVAKRQRSQATSVDLITLRYPGRAPLLGIDKIAYATMERSGISGLEPRSSPQ